MVVTKSLDKRAMYGDCKNLIEFKITRSNLGPDRVKSVTGSAFKAESNSSVNIIDCTAGTYGCVHVDSYKVPRMDTYHWTDKTK